MFCEVKHVLFPTHVKLSCEFHNCYVTLPRSGEMSSSEFPSRTLTQKWEVELGLKCQVLYR